MAFQPVLNTVAMHLRGTLHSVPVENVLNFTAITPITQEDLAELADTAADLFAEAGVRNLFPNEFTWREIYVVDLSTPIALAASDVSIAGVTGTGTAGAPGNVTFALKFTTGFTGRSARGRLYWMGIPEAVITGNAVSNVYAGQLASTIEALTSLALTAGFVHVVVSRTQAGVKLPVGETFTVINVTYSDLRTDSQRGRLA